MSLALLIEFVRRTAQPADYGQLNFYIHQSNSSLTEESHALLVLRTLQRIVSDLSFLSSMI